jgi:predicted amidohydrolase
MAQKYHTNIAGTLIEKSYDGGMYNSLVIFNRDGALCGKYHKAHVFSHQGSDEGKYITAGDGLIVAELDFGMVGLSICYDLRFPELYRSLALAGAQIVICPAAWPDVRVSHWQTLLRARAIENQFFMLGVNQVGKVTFSRTDAGCSALIDPWGETIAECNSTEDVLRAEIDLIRIEEVRTKIPVLQDRRDDIYEI